MLQLEYTNVRSCLCYVDTKDYGTNYLALSSDICRIKQYPVTVPLNTNPIYSVEDIPTGHCFDNFDTVFLCFLCVDI